MTSTTAWLIAIVAVALVRKFDEGSREWLDDVAQKPARLLRRIWHVLVYVPLLWDDTDWDYSSLYFMVIFKLKRMEAAIRDGYNTRADEVADTVKEARLVLERVATDDYWTWRAYQDLLIPDEYLDKPKHRADGCVEYVSNLPEEHAKEFKEITEREEALKRQDLEHFGKLFSKYSRTWWD